MKNFPAGLLATLSLLTTSVLTTRAQNVGVNTSSPRTALDVHGSIRTDSAFTITPTSRAAAAALSFPARSTSAIVITASSGTQANVITLTGTPREGQWLTIRNQDGDPATVAGFGVAAGAVAQLLYLGGAWKLASAPDNLGSHTASRNLNLNGQLLTGGGTQGLAVDGSGSVGITTTAPDASAALDVVSSSKGALLPRLSEAARLGIAAPAAGLLAYQTDGSQPGFWYNAGGNGVGSAPAVKWQRLTDSSTLSYSPQTGLQVGPGPVGAAQPLGQANGGSGNPSPYYSNPDQRIQYLLRSADLSSAGLHAGPLSSLSFTVTAKGSTGPFQNFVIKLANTNTSSVTTTFPSLPTTTVFSGTVTTAVGLNTHVFSTPFSWDGSSNLYVEICFDNPSAVGIDQVALFTTSYLSCSFKVGTNVCGTPNAELPIQQLPVVLFTQPGAYTLPPLSGQPGQVLTQQANGAVTFQSLPASPWMQSGTSLYAASPGSFVGIGTTTPSARLHVAGTLKLQAGATVSELSTDGTLAGSSDTALPTEKAVKTYVDNKVAARPDSDNQALSAVTTAATGSAAASTLVSLSNGGSATIPGDNLGTHTASQNVNLNDNWLSNDGDSEGLRVANDGSVGIGTASPGAALDVQAGPPLTSAGTGTATQLRLTRSGTFGTKWNSSAELAVGSYAAGLNSKSQLDFRLGNNSNALADQTVLTLRGDGKVGVGTSNPTAMLANTSNNIIAADNYGSAATSLSWETNAVGYTAQFYNAGSGLGSGGLAVKVASPNVGALDVSQHATSVGTAGNSLFHVHSNGNVGIGTVTPTARLEVASGEVRLPGGGGSSTHFNYTGDNKNYIRGSTIIGDQNGNTVSIGQGGSALTRIVKATVTADVPAIAGGFFADVDFTVTGAQPGGAVSVSPQNDFAVRGCSIASARVVAANTVRVRFQSVLGAADIAAQEYYIMVVN
jgi:hypothetical protein